MKNLMPTYMASWIIFALFLILPLPLFMRTAASIADAQLAAMNPFTCSLKDNRTCPSMFYQSNDLQKEQIAVYYSVHASDIYNVTDIFNITDGNKQDYLVEVPCSCKNINGTIAYFYDTVYTVKESDIFPNVSAQYYSGQAWPAGGEEGSFITGAKVPIHLLCGCVPTVGKGGPILVITYTVQQQDTLSRIADKFYTEVDLIQMVNTNLANNSTYIEAGWVLYVPCL